jgi:hypothetical protein
MSTSASTLVVTPRHTGVHLAVLAPVLPACGLILLSVAVITGIVRGGQGVPGVDSGVFLYIGHALLAGQVPYKDVWDHKPPAIYFIDALGLWLGAGSLWGIWLLESLSLALAGWCTYSAIRRDFGAMPAFAGSVAWICSMPLVCNGGNVTEEWALLPAAALIFAFSRWRPTALSWRATAAIGACGALMLLCRQTAIGLLLAALLLICLARLRQNQRDWLVGELAAALAGFALPCLVVLGYFAVTGAIPALWDQAIHYNALYGQTDLHTGLLAVLAGWSILSLSGLGGLALAGWLGLLAAFRGGHARAPLMLLAILDLPVECGLSMLPGRVSRGYLHYFLTWLPELGLLCAFLLFLLLRTQPRGPLLLLTAGMCLGSQLVLGPLVPGFLGGVAVTGIRYWPFLLLVVALLAAAALAHDVQPRLRSASVLTVVCTTLLAGAWAWAQGSTYPANQGPTGMPAITRIIDCQTHPGQTLLVWGDFPWLNLLARCDAPGAYVYQAPLFTLHYTDQAMVDRLLADLRRHPPARIVDVAYATGTEPRLDAAWDSSWHPESGAYGITPAVLAVRHYVLDHYRALPSPSGQQFVVYAPTRQ